MSPTGTEIEWGKFKRPRKLQFEENLKKDALSSEVISGVVMTKMYYQAK